MDHERTSTLYLHEKIIINMRSLGYLNGIGKRKPYSSYLPALINTNNYVRKVVAVHWEQSSWENYGRCLEDVCRMCEGDISSMQKRAISWGEDFPRQWPGFKLDSVSHGEIEWKRKAKHRFTAMPNGELHDENLLIGVMVCYMAWNTVEHHWPFQNQI
jgi:hypothetical protein